MLKSFERLWSKVTTKLGSLRPDGGKLARLLQGLLQTVNYCGKFFEARGTLRDASGFEIGDQVQAKALGSPDAMLRQS